jgi:hypothetical protein
MKVLLRNHGVNLSGVKSDLYTGVGKCQTELLKVHGNDFGVRIQDSIANT